MADPPPTGDEDSSSSRRRRWPWAVLGLVIALGLVAGWAALRHQATSSGSQPRRSPGSSPGPAFAFAKGSVRIESLRGGGNRKEALDVADSVRATLSGFYQAAFVDPRAWSGTIPSQAWNAFAPETRQQAQGDAASLTLGKVDAAITDLQATASSVRITVLFDAMGHSQAAFADVTFTATAVLTGGEGMRVTNGVHFYLQPISGSWLISGYPGAHTRLSAPAPVTGASPSPDSSTSPLSPSPTGS